MTSPRFLAALAVLFIAVDVVSADGTLESAEFLQVADALSPCPFNEQERFPSSSLPKAVSDHLWRDYYQPSGEERLPDAIGGFALDLNEDGNLEYFLEPPLGGSGGTHYAVVSRLGGVWREVLSLQGQFCLLPPVGGWHPVVAMYRGGWEIYGKSRYEFSDARSRRVWSALFDHGKVTEAARERPHPTAGRAPDGSAPGQGASSVAREATPPSAPPALSRVTSPSPEK
jgi:hypothetical protein